MADRCCICGALLSEDNHTGIGYECREAMHSARMKKFFHDPQYEELRREYNRIRPSYYIAVLKGIDESYPQSKFAKSFIPSIIEQYESKRYLSRKQMDIASRLIYEIKGIYESYQEQMISEMEFDFRHSREIQEIEVSREEIEIERQKVRKGKSF